MIQFRFIENGLLKGQHCIYTTHEDMDISLIENEMADSRIDVEAFEKMNLLVICQIPDPRNYREGSVFGYDSIVKDILADLKRPSIFRRVSRAIPEVKKEDQLADELDIECTYHSSFDGLGGSLLCSYSVEEIEPRKCGKWIAELLQNHHLAIFIRKSWDGIASIWSNVALVQLFWRYPSNTFPRDTIVLFSYNA